VPESSTLWRVWLTVPPDAAGLVEQALADDAVAVSRFERQGAADWQVEALFAHPPDRAHLAARLAVAAAAAGVVVEPPAIEPVVEKDWVRESQANLPPLQSGRYYVHGSHDAPARTPNRIDLTVDAGPAFGTGRHGSTMGCLRAIGALHGQSFARILDLGCGSGILALAMARTWPAARILASDIDPDAVATTRANARRNGVAARVRTVTSDGLSGRAMRCPQGYQLIVANILAKPLVALAPHIAAHRTPGGTVILSGLLADQEQAVLAAYRMQGLPLVRRVTVDGWRTLVLR
jgi:ribosomal protein L11 methyltransferase